MSTAKGDESSNHGDLRSSVDGKRESFDSPVVTMTVEVEEEEKLRASLQLPKTKSDSSNSSVRSTTSKKSIKESPMLSQDQLSSDQNDPKFTKNRSSELYSDAGSVKPSAPSEIDTAAASGGVVVGNEEPVSSFVPITSGGESPTFMESQFEPDFSSSSSSSVLKIKYAALKVVLLNFKCVETSLSINSSGDRIFKVTTYCDNVYDLLYMCLSLLL
jgi:hypothetical protein